MTKIICLLTCHNRSKKTSAAVESVAKIFKELGLECVVCAVLDNCSDDTNEKLLLLDRTIEIICHNGADLYWAGGMRLGFEKYVKDQDFDTLLCINDDVELYIEETVHLLSLYFGSDDFRESVYIGSFESDEGETSYGGLKRTFSLNPLRLHRIDPYERKVPDTFNMNFVIIPSKVLDAVGFLDQNYQHSKADLDFGYRIKFAKFKMILSPVHVGRCNRNEPIAKACLQEPSIERALTCINSVLREPFNERKIFLKQHGYFATRLLQLYSPYLKFLCKYVFYRVTRYL